VKRRCLWGRCRAHDGCYAAVAVPRGAAPPLSIIFTSSAASSSEVSQPAMWLGSAGIAADSGFS